MKLQDLILDSSSGVYTGNAEIKQIRYLDGSEQYLKEVLTSAYDLSFFSKELQSKIKDWPSLYHLSPHRATIIDCFDFQNKEAKILELGAGCGAVTRWLGEHFQDVRAVEGSFQRASIARLRCRDLFSVKVYAANFYDLDVEKQFDVVTLIGVLEYSHLYHPLHNGNSYEAALATLQFAHGAIKDHGILILAIENKLGLKYFSGAKEDHTGRSFDGIQGYPAADTPVTFSAGELDRLLRKAGFTSVDFYLPFPDYKITRTIINAQAITRHHHYLYNWIETPFPDRVSEQRLLLFNESLALREILKSGMLREFSNSFLIIAHKDNKKGNFQKFGFSDHDWIARHYSLNRHIAFCKRVTLSRSPSGSLEVNNSLVFGEPSSTNPADSVFTHTLVSEKFCPGDLLLFSVFEILALEKFNHMFQPLLEKFKRFLLDHFSVDECDEMGIPLLNGDALDITLWNIIVAEETGDWIIIDREWTCNRLLPIDFVLWRNLYHLFFTRFSRYFEKYHSGKSHDEVIYEILKKIFPNYNSERMTLAKQFDLYFAVFTSQGSVAEKMKQLEASVIIVTYNSEPSIRACLDSVLQHTSGAEVIVVDNASTDKTHAILSEYGDRVTSILNDENKGFSYACNQGIRASRGEYIILLNPDTIVTPMWADRMIAHFNIGVGAVGPLSNYAAALQRLDLYLREPLPAEMGINDFNDLAEKLYNRNCGRGRETRLLIGFCIALPRKVLDEVGLLDEDLFLGNDDLELSWRLRQHGYRLLIATDTFIYHEGQMSFKSQKVSTSDLTQGSTDRLYAKLEAYYGVGNVPTPMELWGIDFFRPEGARFRSAKPTVAAVYCIYDDITWLTDSIESIYYIVDAIYFLIGEKPWHGESTDNLNTLECIKKFPDPAGKIHLICGTWTNETDQRNAGLDMLSKAGFTYCFVIDADEIYDPLDLQRMKEMVTSHPEIACWYIALDTYWKSYRYRIEPREQLKPVVFVKVGAARFTQNRHVGGENHSLIPSEIGICHYLGYARSDEDILKKISTSSHAHDVQSAWFENIWKKWDSDRSLINLHPTHPHTFQQAVEQPYSALPPVLKRLYSADAQKSSDMTSSLTSIIILSYNQWDQTELCLKSIEMYTPEPHEIIIVDNGSSDGTIEHLRDHIKANKNVRVISNSTNRGFAGGNNQGIKLARGEYILLLNNDTVVTEGWLGRMLNIFNRYPKTGIVGPMSNNVNGPQLVTKADYKNFGELVDFAARRMKENDGSSLLAYRVVGFCLLVRREVIDNIGGLDEQFLSGNFEDDDFCIRAILSGYEIRVAQDVFIHHTGSQTFRGASIDHQEKILHNWELFKKKWKIPVERHFDYWELFTTRLKIPVDASPESAYRLPFQPPSGLSLHVPLPDVFYDHTADEDNRWLHEIDVKHQEQRIQD